MRIEKAAVNAEAKAVTTAKTTKPATAAKTAPITTTAPPAAPQKEEVKAPAAAPVAPIKESPSMVDEKKPEASVAAATLTTKPLETVVDAANLDAKPAVEVAKDEVTPQPTAPSAAKMEELTQE